MNITSEINEMGNILDKCRELSEEWDARYKELKKIESRTLAEEDEFKKLKIRLGYASPVNGEIECEGCGS